MKKIKDGEASMINLYRDPLAQKQFKFPCWTCLDAWKCPIEITKAEHNHVDLPLDLRVCTDYTYYDWENSSDPLNLKELCSFNILGTTPEIALSMFLAVLLFNKKHTNKGW